ncbi:MAG: nucleotidyltransferase domain-containing protein, partial [Candidatus Bathyarchaeia archaeon]
MSRIEKYYKARYEKFKILLKWRSLLPKLLNAVKKVIPDAEVYIFGSALKNKLTANSDIDVLIVSDKASGFQRHKLAVAIEENLSNPFIFELHLIPKEKLSWY